MGLVGGVLALNAVVTAVGFCVLAPALRGRPPFAWATYAGLALLMGTAAVVVALCVLAPFGVHTGLAAFFLVAVAVAALGIAAALLAPAGWRRAVAIVPHPSAWPATLVTDVIATAAAFVLAALALIALIGAFRSSPWLDDTWYFWLPKGRALDLTGLDARLWTPTAHLNTSFGDGGESLTFIRPDNPLGWSILLDLVMRFVGSVDMRAVNGEQAFLLLAFVAALARLLWGRVRPELLLPGLVLLYAAPELLRQSQGGAADVPLAEYLALALLGAAAWLLRGRGFGLLLVALCGAMAIQTKSEGLLELLLYLGILCLFAARSWRALLWLAAATAAAIATIVPWLVWRHIHHIAEVFSLHDALSPSYLRGRTPLLHQAEHVLGHHFASTREWSLIVPLTIVLGIAAAVRDRRPVWLAPAAFLGAGYLFFVWVTWADPQGEFRLVASAYRYVTPPIVVAGAFLPLLAERTLRPKTTGVTSARAAKK